MLTVDSILIHLTACRSCVYNIFFILAKMSVLIVSHAQMQGRQSAVFYMVAYVVLEFLFFAVVEELWENYVDIMGVLRKYYVPTIWVSREYFISIVWMLQWRRYYGECALLLLCWALCGLCPSCLPAPGPSFATTSTSHPIPLHSAPELLTYSYKLTITLLVHTRIRTPSFCTRTSYPLLVHLRLLLT